MPSILVDSDPLVALATPWRVLTELSHLLDSNLAVQNLQNWVEQGGLTIRPMGTDEFKKIWTIDRNDFETYRLPARKKFKLVGV